MVVEHRQTVHPKNSSTSIYSLCILYFSVGARRNIFAQVPLFRCLLFCCLTANIFWLFHTFCRSNVLTKTVLVMKTFTFLSYPILNLTSSILHHASSTLHPTYCILHPTSSILNPTSSIQHPASYILHPTSSIQHKKSIWSDSILSNPILTYPTKIFKIILVKTKIQCSPAILLYISLVICATKKEFTLIDCCPFH